MLDIKSFTGQLKVDLTNRVVLDSYSCIGQLEVYCTDIVGRQTRTARGIVDSSIGSGYIEFYWTYIVVCDRVVVDS